MKVSLLSPGRDPLSHLRTSMAKVDSASFDGTWAAIEIQPDLFSLQKFCVGIAIEAEGQLVYRMVENLKKFEGVYGSAKPVTDLLAEAEASLQRAARDRTGLDGLTFGTQNVALSPQMPTSGASVAAALERLFRDTVVMAPAETAKRREFEALDTNKVRSLVDNRLKQIARLAHAQVAINTKECLVVDRDATHVLDVTYRSKKGVGNLVSAVVKTPDTADLNVLRGVENLETFARLKRLDDRALFIMAAKKEQLSPNDYKRVMVRIDEHEWRLEKRGVRVVTFDDPEPIALAVLEWAGVQPA